MMRHRLPIFALTLCCPCVCAAAALYWSFVDSVGGITIGDPLPIDGGWRLPLQADVTGLQSFSSKPTTLNSGLSCAKVRANVAGHNIYLTIYTGLAGRGLSGRCPAAWFSSVATGQYEVFYLSPDGTTVHLRDVRVGL